MIDAKKMMMLSIMMIGILLINPVSAIVPPDDYFIKDGYGNGQPVHDGIQLGYVWWITADNRQQHFNDVHLGLTEYKLKQSHDEQEKLAFARYAYQYSMPDVPYEPNETPCVGFDCGVVRNTPETDTYEPAHGSAIFR